MIDRRVRRMPPLLLLLPENAAVIDRLDGIVTQSVAVLSLGSGNA